MKKIENEYEEIMEEATKSVEKMLSLEDEGWVNFSKTSNIISESQRINTVETARIYSVQDPLARQAINLWINYTFGSGVYVRAKEEAAQKILDVFWDDKDNRKSLSVEGQRKSGSNLLIDGELFIVLFLSPGKVVLRQINPLEIVEIITNPEDIEDVKFYKRVWTNQLSESKTSYYRDINNPKGESAQDSTGKTITEHEEALIFHVTFNASGQRGNSLLTPALDWIKQYRKFMASRIAITLAMAKFVWKLKQKGGQNAVNTAKTKFDDTTPQSGSMLIGNMGSDMQPIKADTGASNAYQDARLLRLQVCAAVGIPEQYLTGDIAIGNFATSKTVELPLLKQFQAYQQLWADVYKTIIEVVFEHNKVSEDKREVDFDFPEIAPTDTQRLLAAITGLGNIMPELVKTRDVKQIILSNIGIADPNATLDSMDETDKETDKETESNPNAKLIKALQGFKESIKNKKEA